MPILLAAINSILNPYWDTLKKRLAKDDVSSLTIVHSPNLFGHPIGLLILVMGGRFFIPRDPIFFLCWFMVIGLAACGSIFGIWGLLETKFFAVEIIGSLSFVANSIFAILILKEHLKYAQTFAIILALIGVILFVWPKKEKTVFTFDRGVLFVILSVILGGLGSVFYKMATFHTPNYATFLTGRFIGDLIGWTTIWLISMAMIKRNPISELRRVYGKKYGFGLVLGIAITSLLGSWLIYKLPVITMAMLSTLVFPASYFLSQLKYKEKITLKMWLGTSCIVGALGLFLI
jgi:drug/metabolite transporter (DMT)-like permease